MANIKSAKKRALQAVKKTTANRMQKEQIKDSKKSFLASLGTPESAEAYRLLTKKLDKAAKTNAIHKNKASRLKSRFGLMLPRSTEK
ncbi:30S ribosomal protein S20 [candidate division WWE3 bacterium RIFCSPLOWO2_01_FULL_42_11]|uniref:Small ribosomal subunit protein bS20 n=1 Tax=candidate division WWE3 bacterium RIFCSPLOWO2_01_FULL_42_11 TaxID=1802627 RepID=A0A1F4VMJ4_UNCKA|nr:MAG: 30S ribosomal protein S20 [candidate division WWE3 bacterium RIFCSPLOWO2_01_FULL_42_11]